MHRVLASRIRREFRRSAAALPHTNLDHAMGIAIRCLSRHPAPPRIHSHTELVRPARRVKRLPLERIDAGDVRQVCRRQNSHRRNQELCPRALAGFGFDDPANRHLVTEARVQNRQRDLRDLWRTDKSDCVHRRSGGDQTPLGASRCCSVPMNRKPPTRGATPRTPTPR